MWKRWIIRDMPERGYEVRVTGSIIRGVTLFVLTGTTVRIFYLDLSLVGLYVLGILIGYVTGVLL